MYTLTGGPGTGKTTQIELLAACGYATISTGSLLREKGSQRIQEQMLEGDLTDHDYTNSLIGQALDESKASHGENRIILDGYPRALIQASWLLEVYGANLKACLILIAPDQCVVQRLLDRQRPDDKPDAIERRLEVYRQNIVEVLAYYGERGVTVHEIDANRPVGDVFTDVKEILNRG